VNKTPRSRHGFTLIELLVVIAIIALLAALLLPSLSSSRKAARTAVGCSNLKQIGLALQMYVEDHEGYFPPGWLAGLTEWDMAIQPYVGKNNDIYSVTDPSRVFVCPNATWRPSGSDPDNARLSYSAHPVLMKSTASPGFGYYSLIRVARPGELVMVMDGCQSPVINNRAYALAEFVDSIMQTNFTTATDNDAPINPGLDVDTDAAKGQIRWRQKSGGANFLFVDGHVQTLMKGQVLKRNVRTE
jgi:prepilin-type N-terminal cleavage/methylation domain-containing protein/prepilin-type processing-associated H-X9-DG protein